MERLEAVRVALREFVREREWEQFHDPKNLVMAVASEAGELAALLRWVPNSEADAAARATDLRARLAAEIADVAMSLLLLCDRIGVDLVDAIDDKLAVNRCNYPPAETRGRAERVKRPEPG